MIKLSVIIPTRNRAKTLEKALTSLTKQSIEQRYFEVIIVDNGSTDETKSIVDSYHKRIENLIYLYDETPGLHIGRHRGLLAAKADILVFADDDIEASTTWLEAILDSFKDESVVLVGGKNLPSFESAPPKWLLEIWENDENFKVIGSLSILDLGDDLKEINPNFVYGCNFSIRKDILIEAGGFHPDGMPDNLIKYRGDGESYVSKHIYSKGYKTIYNPKASVFHLVSKERMSKEYFAKRSFNQGISDSYRDIREGKKHNLFMRKVKLFIKNYILKKDVKIERSYLDGYMYHQNEVKRDDSLLEWVKRDNYIKNGSIN